jgi:peptidoglycan/LPS O-acetylase OafA/YrhL
MKPAINRAYYPALDGLRGIAILLVLFYHNFSYVPMFEFGWLGVDLFFVLSGFLITDILLQTKGTKNYLKNFYVRRILRIFPIYYLCLFLFIIVMPRLTKVDFDMTYYSDNQSWLWIYLQNWLYIAKQTPQGASHLQHFWSLAVEEQFYMVWPLVVLLCRKMKTMLYIITGVLVFVLATRVVLWMNHIESVSYFNLYTFSRIDGLCIGCILSLTRYINVDFIRNNLKKIVLCLVVGNVLFLLVKKGFNLSIPYLGTFGYFSLASLFGILVYITITEENKIIKTLNNRYLKFFGKISYSLYVFHWPIYLIVFPYVEAAVQNISKTNLFSSQLIGSSVCSIVAVGISILSYKYFESFFLRLKKHFA